MNEAVHKNEYIHSLFRYIENNMASDLGNELLKSVGHVSCAQLYRDFYSLTGHSVSEYIRKRRLSNALALIKTSGIGLTEIALQCGYSSHQALCRAVRQALKCTPSEYRSGDKYYFFPPYGGEPIQSVTVSGEAIPGATRVLFYQSSLRNIENAAVGALLRALPGYGGRIFGRNGEQAGGRLCYELYLTDIKNDLSRLEALGFEVAGEVPCRSATFATSTVKNDERMISAAWDYLYSGWLHDSMFEYTDQPYYEEYILRGGRPTKLKLYLPIRRRHEDTKITLVPDPDLRFIAASAAGYGAERRASRAVIDYLAAHHPYIVRTSKEFYLRKEMDSYTCGVRTMSGISPAGEDGIRAVATTAGRYLVLESSVTGEYDRYAAMLLTFARDNGMLADPRGIFAVYDARESFDNPRIKMYCPVKLEKI